MALLGAGCGFARWRVGLRHLLMAAALWAMTPMTSLAAAPATSAEYQVKAVFLFNFAQFVEWPEQAFPSRQAPVVIGVWSGDPFGSYLDELVRDEKIGARAMVVRRCRTVEEAAKCQIVFLGRSAGADEEPALARLRGQPVLTVGESELFNRRGGIIRFVTENGKIRVRINIDAVQASRLTISSKLLSSATLVTTERD